MKKKYFTHEEVKEAQREYARKKKSWRLESRKEYRSKWEKENKDFCRKYYKKRYEKLRVDPEFKKKRNARCAVHRAIERGELERQLCEVCKQRMGEAHHMDYDKPLEVSWLCRKCHAKSHAKYS